MGRAEFWVIAVLVAWCIVEVRMLRGYIRDQFLRLDPERKAAADAKHAEQARQILDR